MQFWQLQPVAGLLFIEFSQLLGWHFITCTVRSKMFTKIMVAPNSWHLVSISVPSWIRFVSAMDLIPFCSLKYLEYSILFFSEISLFKKKKKVKLKLQKSSSQAKRIISTCLWVWNLNFYCGNTWRRWGRKPWAMIHSPQSVQSNKEYFSSSSYWVEVSFLFQEWNSQYRSWVRKYYTTRRVGWAGLSGHSFASALQMLLCCSSCTGEVLSLVN